VTVSSDLAVAVAVLAMSVLLDPGGHFCLDGIFPVEGRDKGRGPEGFVWQGRGAWDDRNDAEEETDLRRIG
jgi:hypothetical protein